MAKKDFKSGLNALLSSKPKPAPKPKAPRAEPDEKQTATPAQPVVEPTSERMPDAQSVAPETASNTYWSEETDKRLSRVARFKSKTKSDVVREAIDFYLKFQVEVD